MKKVCAYEIECEDHGNSWHVELNRSGQIAIDDYAISLEAALELAAALDELVKRAKEA